MLRYNSTKKRDRITKSLQFTFAWKFCKNSKKNAFQQKI